MLPEIYLLGARLPLVGYKKLRESEALRKCVSSIKPQRPPEFLARPLQSAGGMWGSVPRRLVLTGVGANGAVACEQKAVLAHACLCHALHTRSRHARHRRSAPVAAADSGSAVVAAPASVDVYGQVAQYT